MKCIVCGAKESVERGLCEDCLFNSVNLSYDSSEEIVICPKCDAAKIRKKWYYRNSEREIEKKISSGVRVTGMNDAVFELEFEHFDLSRDDSISFKSQVTSPGGNRHVFSGVINLKKTRNSCPECNKKTGSYYEAVIQIRSSFGEHDPSIDDVVSTALSMENRLEREHTNSFISKVEKKPEGIDIFLGRKNDAAQIAKVITDSRPCSLIVTKSLAGRREGEDFYRFTYGIRVLSLVEGSVISTKEGTFLIRSVGIEYTRMTDVNTGNERSIRSDSLLNNSYKVLEKRLEKKRFIVVSRNDEEVDVMDPDSFKISTVRMKIDGNEVDLYSYADGLF